MPKIDFPNKQIPQGYEPPEPPIELVEDMEIEDVRKYMLQELYKIYKNNDSYLTKEMSKEDICSKLIEKNYDLDELFPIEG